MAERSGTLKGSSLSIDLHGAKSVEIVPSDQLRDISRIFAKAETEEEIDELDLLEGAAASVRQKEGGTTISMSRDGSSVSVTAGSVVIIDGRVISGDVKAAREVTLQLRIEVPTDIPIKLNLSGQVPLAAGELTGRIRVTCSGQCSVAIQSAGELDVDVSGQSQIRVGVVNGGDVAADVSGQSRVEIARGTIGSLEVDASGQSSFGFRGTAKSAELEASGMAGIDVDEVLGALERDQSGMARINVRRNGIAPDGGMPTRGWR